MTPQQCKTLLDSGVLQAYAEGKFIQEYNHCDHGKGWYDVLSMDHLMDGQYKYRVKPEKKTGWINIYPDSNNVGYRLYNTKQKADDYATRHRIACIQITYEEGEGL